MRRMILIAHDDRRNEMIEWIRSRRHDLVAVELFADRPTASEVASRTGLPVSALPDGLDEALGASGKRIEEGLADLVVFFWKPRIPDSRAEAARALLSLAEVHDVPTALNPWTADFFLASLKKGARRGAAVPGGSGWPGRRAWLRIQGL